MIYLFFGFLMLLVVGGIFWYLSQDIVASVFNSVSTAYPSYFTGTWVTFINALWDWMPFLLIMFGGLLWIYVNSQTPEVTGY